MFSFSNNEQVFLGVPQDHCRHLMRFFFLLLFAERKERAFTGSFQRSSFCIRRLLQSCPIVISFRVRPAPLAFQHQSYFPNIWTLCVLLDLLLCLNFSRSMAPVLCPALLRKSLYSYPLLSTSLIIGLRKWFVCFVLPLHFAAHCSPQMLFFPYMYMICAS